MSAARTEATLLAPEPAFQSAFRRLLVEALYAADQVSGAYRSAREDEAWEAEADRREKAAFDAKQALQTYLLVEHGIGRDLAERMGEIL